jgi:hypothetical protein
VAPFLGPLFVSKRGPPILKKNVPPQVLKAWGWMNYLLENIPATKKKVLINLDETAVHYYYGDRKGNVFKKTKIHQK